MVREHRIRLGLVVSRRDLLIDPWAIIILAAGQGTRMKSRVPKVLHPLGGQPLIRHSTGLARALVPQRPPVVVVGHGADGVRAELGDEVEYVEQAQQLGTGHAVLQARPALEGRAAQLVIFYADMPLLTRETVQRLMALHQEKGGPLTLLTVIADEARGFGRIVRDEAGRILGIVEEAQATPAQLAINELNPGVYVCDAAWLWPRLASLPLSPKGEYYLTDIVGLAVAEGVGVETCTTDDPGECLGINTRVHLAEAEATLRGRINRRWMLAGVTLLDPATTYLGAEVEIGPDTVIYPNTHLWGKTKVGQECIIGPNTLIRDSTIGNQVQIECSVIEGAIVEDKVDVGPFAHLRKGAHLATGVHMGNFGEVKNSYLGPGTKMGHFSYLGDAQLGENVNIGAGTITCNYDGVRKQRTVIEDGAFIGSDTMLVAPVRVGRGAKTGAGSVVTHDVPPESLAYGVPARVKKSPGDGSATASSSGQDGT
ncbi:MAG: bifunctional UDP-N-acetylglucosamine diphosphorylase/glucosamine-1-phosphate N-acetyltransferase GlmU [Anaerolineae bacterium]|nr:bifunctional UDP-N-acetylglucosamine diphosphorylase/glucosamine-1-phosphate N-acetyltransferase GlmU [Anaerolineae bacterium]